MNITKAVVPVAGLGTRLLPLTMSVPKVMFPVGSKPVLQHVVEELAAAGIREIVFVVGKDEAIIRNHFRIDPVLEKRLEQKGETELLENLRYLHSGASFSFVRQNEPHGLGHAILLARDQLGEEPFIVALGDSIIEMPSGDSLVKGLIDVRKNRNAAAVVAVQEVDEAGLSKYGIVSPLEGEKGDVLALGGLVEKPGPEAAPSNLAIASRYAFTPEIFFALEQVRPEDPKREWQITDAMIQLLNAGKKVFAVKIGQGKRHDIGHFAGYFRVFSHFAEKELEGGSQS